MFNIVPSNRQEYLLEVLIALLNNDYQSGKLGIFDASTIMVESLGMKHYIHMGIASKCQVAMNIDFPLVSRCIYSMCRSILGDDYVPKESLYKREIMVWRIEALLHSEEFINDPKASFANEYWQQSHDPQQARFLLAQNTADVFEQYMQFRPQWFKQWEEGLYVSDHQSEPAQALLEPWQQALWCLLIKESEQYPANIIEQATQAFEPNKFQLPKVLYIFAVNALTPQQLTFLKVISEQVEIFLFHLNPCVEFWGDLVSEKALLHQKLKQGITQLLDSESPNALLANLGKQGRVLFNQLQDIEYPDFTDKQLFVQANDGNNAGYINETPSLLSVLQDDLLKADTSQYHELNADNSISIHSCHSALREIQVLHDYLLHIIQSDSENQIKPHDIIVLCPAIEDYAPYVKSVFRSVYDEELPNEPRLVSSIADRAPLDSDPLVSMFMDMLCLPDSRFSASAIIDYLHIEAVQQKFNFSPSELDLCERWIADANIYWGKDIAHKQQVLGQGKDAKLNELYTWEWGLSRLLKSAYYSHDSELDFAYLDNVEGQDLNVLAKLILFLDRLHTINRHLQTPRPMLEWLSYLQTDVLDTLFSLDSDKRVLDTLKKEIEQVASNVIKANHHDEVPISVLQEALNAVLSKPDPLNQFNTGQVTFSSMVPMRSVPFKVVCMLGLNDGVFPRSTTPISIDMMTLAPKQNTDRSRRNEDRYMFLEALISARHYLYLSYQGKSIKNNAEREPSLVLREFMAHLEKSFKLDLLTQHPMQAFSPREYTVDTSESSLLANKPSFSQSWLSLASSSINLQAQVKGEFTLPSTIDSQSLSAFYQSPLGSFAQHHMGLHFERFTQVQEDVEPFSLDALMQFKINQAMLESCLHLDNTDKVRSFDAKLNDMLARGDYPELEKHKQLHANVFEQLITTVDFDEFNEQGLEHYFETSVSSSAFEDTKQESEITLSCVIKVDSKQNTNILLTRSLSSARLFEFYIMHAIKRQALGHDVSSRMSYMDMKAINKQHDALSSGREDKSAVFDLSTLELNDEAWAPALQVVFLSHLMKGYQQCMQAPSFVHIDLAPKLIALDKACDLIQDSTLVAQELADHINESAFEVDCQRYLFPDGCRPQDLDIALLKAIFVDGLPHEWIQ